ncbi:hypothetical protein SISSUDRAFT_1040153 [Sistotremastrum suecicum HHB10207 ss-3]|uniref:Aminoglycoside phosphotransferase domain-containing protein n=1 Tax=Sistotremastrum suecicum HHB10207 ss-3 TaxID=1314776 RepID=A0A166IEK9_9AGAM|nr:hypothetical protein SISSUDRAFT_1040153 [Sistotremastrum suecicum HHB10207 ss-3]
MAMLHEDDQLFSKSNPIRDDQIIQLFEKELHPSDPISSITAPPTIQASYHKIYFITLASGREAVLRLARPCIPHIKVENEVAVLCHVARTTTVPVPAVWFWSSDANSPDNILGYEYIVMDKINARSLESQWRHIPPVVFDSILDQVIDHWLALRTASFGSSVGGLRFGRTPDGKIDTTVIEPGPVVEEVMWQTPDVKRYWTDLGINEDFASLNIKGPYSDYRRYLQDHLRIYARNISLHPTLEFARHFIPRIEQLVINLDDDNFDYTRAAKDVAVYLAHQDTHLGNLLFEGDRIVSMLDWEFSGLYPGFIADPSKYLVWDMGPEVTPEMAEQRPLAEIWRNKFTTTLAKRAPEVEREIVIPNELKHLYDAWNFLRCIIEVAPRGARLELAHGSWSQRIDDALKGLNL